MSRHCPPSRIRYEAAHPTVTARVSAEVRAKLDAVLVADGRSFSEWLQAQVGDVTDQREQAMASGHEAGHREGLADGRTQGRAAYLILSAAMLWAQYGDRLGDTSEAWIDKKAVECASTITAGQRDYLRSRVGRSPRLLDAVRRWLDASGISEARL